MCFGLSATSETQTQSANRFCRRHSTELYSYVAKYVKNHLFYARSYKISFSFGRYRTANLPMHGKQKVFVVIGDDLRLTYFVVLCRERRVNISPGSMILSGDSYS
jgi:hypothetical protein